MVPHTHGRRRLLRVHRLHWPRYIEPTKPELDNGTVLIQTLFLLLAPALFAASVYMELGRIVQALRAEDRCLIGTRWLTTIFVTGDVLSFIIAGGGGIMAKKNGSTLTLGSNIIVGGLILQLLFFGFFIIVTVAFDRTIRTRPTSLTKSEVHWYKHLIALYAASALMMIRNLVRVVEYVQGNEGYLLGHEYYLYIFDAVLMLGVMTIFNVLHPSEIKVMLRGGLFSKDAFRLRTFNKSST